VDVSESSPEPWVAMGYFSLKSKRCPRAVYFAQKVHITCGKYILILICSLINYKLYVDKLLAI